MKKNILLAIILLFTTTGFAQQGFHLGLSGTFNSTWILNQNNYGTLAPFRDPVVRGSEMAYKYTWGGNFGGVVGHNFTEHWGIQAEVQFNITGQKYDDNFSGPATIPEGSFGAPGTRVNVKRSISLGYIQIPLMGKYISGGKKVKFFACLGPQIGLRTGAKETVKIADYTYLPDSLAFSPSEKFKTFDVGITAQAGVEIYASRNVYFDIGLSSYLGLLDINGKVLKTLDWYSKNDVSYQSSRNFRAGLMAGVHFLIPVGSWRHHY